MADLGLLPREEANHKWKAAALKALELDNTLAEAHTSLAAYQLFHDWDFSASGKEFQRAIQLNSSYPDAHGWYSDNLLARGRLEEAVAEAKRAQELDPLSLSVNDVLAQQLFLARRYDDAIAHCQKMIQLEPKASGCHTWLGLACEKKGLGDQALTEVQKGQWKFALAYVYAVQGNKSEARKILEQLQAFWKQNLEQAYFVAIVFAALGEKDKAFEWLLRALGERPSDILHLKIDPMLDPLRPDPRFASRHQAGKHFRDTGRACQDSGFRTRQNNRQ
jgi:tetratricopeptide (TPR) repeat protein